MLEKLRPYLSSWFLLWEISWGFLCAVFVVHSLHDGDLLSAIWFAACMGINWWCAMLQIERIRSRVDGERRE